MAHFQRTKLDTTIKSKFETKGFEQLESKQISQPKKKIIALDQILQKVINIGSFTTFNWYTYFQTKNNELQNERDIELEIVRSLRKNWIPPEEELHEVLKNWASQPKQNPSLGIPQRRQALTQIQHELI